MIKGAIKGLGDDEELPDNVVFCTFDAGVPGNDVKFGKPFTDEEGKAFKKEKRILFCRRQRSPSRSSAATIREYMRSLPWSSLSPTANKRKSLRRRRRCSLTEATKI